MKKIAILTAVVLASSAFAQQVTEADFVGIYAGAQMGRNQSSETLVSGKNHHHASGYPGLLLGQTTVYNGMLVGLEGFVDLHKTAATQSDFGLGVKAGQVFGDVLVFARLAVVGAWPSYRPNVGVGAEYKLDKNFSLTGLLSRDSSTDDGIKRENKNFAVGVNYYFR
jgi:outer membrane immunogenic protein